MKILYISDRRPGGIVNHVKCLTSCLPKEIGRYVIGFGGDEEFAGKNGHDIREFFQIRRVVKSFKPDVVHFNTIPLFMALYLKWVNRVSKVCAIHTPSAKCVAHDRATLNWAIEPCYWLPVSKHNWDSFKSVYPRARGEVFFNPVRLSDFSSFVRVKNVAPIVGMVGRNAAQKDWPSFHKVESLVKVERPEVSFLNAGEVAPCDGRDAIAKMDVFMMTSLHEQLPTTVLECFALGVPICGFIPEGGMSDILALSNGALKTVFIAERKVEKLAQIVCQILDDADLRQRLVDDGRHIVETYFNAEKNVRGRLMEIYHQCQKSPS